MRVSRFAALAALGLGLGLGLAGCSESNEKQANISGITSSDPGQKFSSQEEYYKAQQKNSPYAKGGYPGSKGGPSGGR